MINFSKEIEAFIYQARNTNNKEQNFQGRLYAYLLHLEQVGYIVEMETSWCDVHPMEERTKLPTLAKREIDILVYSKDKSEKYAAELKWFYQPGYHYFDHYKEYQEDFIFTKQLVELEEYDEACCVLVVNPIKMSNPKKDRQDANLLSAFEYKGHNSLSTIQIGDSLDVQIRWKDLFGKGTESENEYFYYVSSFVNKQRAEELMAKKVEDMYHDSPIKSLSLVKESSWYKQLQDGKAVTQESICNAFTDVCYEIDKDIIY